MMEVVVLADRYGVSGLATEISKGSFKKITWGTNVSSVFSLLKQLPHDSEYREKLIDTISKKIQIASSNFEQDFRAECKVLGDEVELAVLQSKMLFVQTVKAKVMQNWDPSAFTKFHKNAMEAIDAYVWQTLTAHGLTSEEPVPKRQRTD